MRVKTSPFFELALVLVLACTGPPENSRGETRGCPTGKDACAMRAGTCRHDCLHHTRAAWRARLLV